VVHENEPVRQTKKQIEPGVARMANERSIGIHENNFVWGVLPALQ
jgi:hypothetical protein